MPHNGGTKEQLRQQADTLRARARKLQAEAKELYRQAAAVSNQIRRRKHNYVYRAIRERQYCRCLRGGFRAVLELECGHTKITQASKAAEIMHRTRCKECEDGDTTDLHRNADPQAADNTQ